MSQSPDHLIHLAPHTLVHSRVHAAVDELNRFAAHPDYGASLETIRAVGRERATHPKAEPNPHDLVARLLNDPDNQDLYRVKLLKNQFCQDMGTASADNKKVSDGFNAYMIQDFLYCARSIFYQTERAMKSTTAEEFKTTAVKVANYSVYAQSALGLCIDPKPAGLAIKDIKVLQAPPTDALNYYTNFQFITAKDNNWVLGLVAMIPCIQSYYAIASSLVDTAEHKDTNWYNLWIKPNSNYKNSGVEEQISFFIANYDAWKDQYDQVKEIFRQACMGEINLWGIAANPPA